MPSPSQEWRLLAACRGLARKHRDLWFPVLVNGQTYKQVDTFKAKQFCKACPVRVNCLDEAMRVEENLPDDTRHGIWGGLTPAQRVDLAARRGGVTTVEPLHGTNAGYIAHMFGDHTPARHAKDGHADYKRNRRTRLYLAQSDTLSCSPTGSVRRIQALVALGHSLRHIDARLDRAHGVTSRWLRNPAPLIFRETAERIERVYDEMSMQIPTHQHTERTRRWAARQGWAPPLAWDPETIDDPDATPNLGQDLTPQLDEVAIERCLGGTLRARHLTIAEREEAVRRAHALGMLDGTIAARMGTADETVFRIRKRLGLGSNDPDQPSREVVA